MADYNRFFDGFGNLSKLAGLGTVIYGIATQDMETIAGGAALAYVGRSITADLWEVERNAIQERKNAILKSKPTLGDKVE